MPEILPEHVPSPRTLLAWDGTAYRPIHIDALGNVQIDVVASALPAGAATEATLASADAYLALITLIRNALRTVGTDRLMVKGEDQLHSFGGVLLTSRSAVVSAADGYVDSDAPGAGVVWVVTRIVAYDASAPTTMHRYQVDHDGTTHYYHQEIKAFAKNDTSEDSTWLHLDQSDFVRVYFIGSGAADNARVSLFGHIMTLET